MPRRRRESPPSEAAQAIVEQPQSLLAASRLGVRDFNRQMLESILMDIDAARAKGSLSVVQLLTAQAMRLRGEIEEAERVEETKRIAMRTHDELVADLLASIADLPDSVFERVLDAVEQRRTGRPRMRVLG